MVLGLSRDDFFDESLEETEFQFSQGDIFLFITDGITEARNQYNFEYGEEKLIETLCESKVLDAGKIRDNIINAVNEFSGNNNQYDDMTVVVVKVL